MRNRLPAVFGGAPKNQAVGPRTERLRVGRTPLHSAAAMRNRSADVIHINCSASAVRGGGDSGIARRLRTWREEKEDRDRGTCHQRELQVFSHTGILLGGKTNPDAYLPGTCTGSPARIPRWSAT